MSQSDTPSYNPSLLALTFPGLLCFAFVLAFVSWVTSLFMPYGSTSAVAGVLAGFFACRKIMDSYHPVITVVAALLLLGLGYLEWFPSEKSCRSMARQESYLVEQQTKAADYWQGCIAPSSDEQGYCADFKPERTIEALEEEREYLSDRRFKRCSR